MRATRPMLPILAVGLIAIIAMTPPADDRPGHVAPAPPPRDEFLIIPLRVHVLSADTLPEIDCRLGDADAHRILGKMNAIWHQAGIHWGLESLIHEPAARPERFLHAREARDGKHPGIYRILLPEATRCEGVVHLYFVHDFVANGAWLGREAIVRERARLRWVEGGIDEPLPRVSAHELGHALGLSHREAPTDLLASGTTGTRLDAAEVKAARAEARALPGVLTFGQACRQAEAAEAAGNHWLAHRLRSWLVEIPGTRPTPTGRAEADRASADASDFARGLPERGRGRHEYRRPPESPPDDRSDPSRWAMTAAGRDSADFTMPIVRN